MLVVFTYVNTYSPMFTHLLVFTYVDPCYSYLPMFTCVYLCLPLFICACLPMFTHVYSCLPIFTMLSRDYICYLCLPLFTCAGLPVYSYLLLFTYVYSCYLCLPLFTRVHKCLPLFTRACIHICGIAGENRPSGAKTQKWVIYTML